MPFRKKAPVSWLIVGLGNPGARYENTRHNVGFWAIDELSRRSDTAVRKIRFHALTADAVVGSQGVLLMKPTTFMNLSGQAVGEAARFFKIPRSTFSSSPTTWTCPWASCASASPVPPAATTV